MQTIENNSEHLHSKPQIDLLLEHLKEWLRKEAHLPDEFDEKWLLAYIRNCKYSLEKCKRKLDMYFTVRSTIPEMFGKRDITHPAIQEIIKFLQIFPLPDLTPEGYRLIILKGDKKTEDPVDVVNCMKLIFMMADIFQVEMDCAGSIFILDTSHSMAKHFQRLTPTLIKKFVLIGLEAFPFIIKGIHIVTPKPWILGIYEIFKLFLPKKISSRIFVHKNINELSAHVSIELMPNEYGGKAGSANNIHDQWIETVKNYQDWFVEQENVKSNEALRLDKSFKFSDVFGVDGSFQQLAID